MGEKPTQLHPQARIPLAERNAANATSLSSLHIPPASQTSPREHFSSGDLHSLKHLPSNMGIPIEPSQLAQGLHTESLM